MGMGPLATFGLPIGGGIGDFLMSALANWRQDVRADFAINELRDRTGGISVEGLNEASGLPSWRLGGQTFAPPGASDEVFDLDEYFDVSDLVANLRGQQMDPHARAGQVGEYFGDVDFGDWEAGQLAEIGAGSHGRLATANEQLVAGALGRGQSLSDISGASQALQFAESLRRAGLSLDVGGQAEQMRAEFGGRRGEAMSTANLQQAEINRMLEEASGQFEQQSDAYGWAAGMDLMDRSTTNAQLIEQLNAQIEQNIAGIRSGVQDLIPMPSGYLNQIGSNLFQREQIRQAGDRGGSVGLTIAGTGGSFGW